MATTRVSFLLLLALLATAVRGGASAHAPASAPAEVASGPTGGSTDCMTLLLGLADCLTYVQSGSTLTRPDKACCPELKSLVDTNPICLCELLANGSSTGFDIDVKRATGLPGVCKVDTPPVDTCTQLGYQIGGPAEGPTEGPSSANGPSAGGMPGAMSPTSAKNNGIRVSGSFVAYGVPLVVGFAASFF